MTGRCCHAAPRPKFAKFLPAAAAAILAVAGGLLSPQAIAAERAPPQAAIASAHPIATAAGHEMLAKGGNAFDAAVAVAATLAVVEPTGSGLGGGGFFLLHVAASGTDMMIDAREKAPAAATRDMFLGADDNPIKGLSLNSALAAGIPGEPAGLALLAQKYGRLPLATTLAPAIRAAREGFPLYPRMQAMIQRKLEMFEEQKDARRTFLADGETPALGTIIRTPQLAETFELLARDGFGAFYTGPFARRLVKGVTKLGGIWTEADLAAYRAVERAPVVGTYRGARIVSASPPAAGGVLLVNALNILSGYDLATADAVTRDHLIVEALRRAYRDRAVYLGDPDFVTVPVAQLTSADYAAGQRTSLRLDRATPSASLPGVMAAGAGPETTHFSILDKEGNRVGGTITLNFLFGSGLMIPGTGILLNNQMDDFSVKAGTPNGFDLVGGDANAIAPGKRMVSSSTPTFVETDKGLMIVGSPGGSYISSMVVLATLAFLDGRSALDIVGAPRFHHQYLPDVVEFESDAFDAATRAGLEARGHTLKESNRRWGNMQVVTWDYASGRVEAAADPRGAGAGHVY